MSATKTADDVATKSRVKKKPVSVQLSELKEEMQEMRQKMMEMEKKEEEMKEMLREMEKRQRDGEERLEARVRGLRSDLKVDVIRLGSDILELRKNESTRSDLPSSDSVVLAATAAAMEETSAKSLKLEGKTNTSEAAFKSEVESFHAITRHLNQRDEGVEEKEPTIIAQLLQRMTCFDLVVNSHLFESVFAWQLWRTVLEMDDECEDTSVPFSSEWFVWPSLPLLQARAQFTYSDYRLRVLLRQPMDVNNCILPTFYCVLKDRTGNNCHRSRSGSFSFTKNLTSELAFEKTFLDLHQEQFSLYQGKNGDLTMEIYMEPLWMAQRVYSNDGVLNWAIDGYEKRKKMAEEGLALYHESPYFYTGPKGYRVRVLMHLAESRLRAEIKFLRGEFDEDLPMTFAHSTTVTLFDRINPKGNVSVTEKRDVRMGAEYSITLYNDKNIQAFIQNDTLYYNVTIK